MAAKRLQQLNDDSTTPLFEVTYMHEHTCNAEPVPPPDVVDATGPPDASGGGFVLNFGSSGAGGHHRDVLMPEKRQQYHHQTVPPSPFSTMGFSSFSNSQLHEMPDDFYPPNVPPPPDCCLQWSRGRRRRRCQAMRVTCSRHGTRSTEASMIMFLILKACSVRPWRVFIDRTIS
ncbi:hypothetical protein EJB05_28414, partial [Eragrostis curvula]